MHAKSLVRVVFAGVTWCALAGIGSADVPAPPVNQTIGMIDRMFGVLTEADCRACHDLGVPDRHHLLHGQPIPPGSFVPHPDADGNGTPDSSYGCLSCHDATFVAERDCTVCHTSNAHHRTTAATSGDCVSCHGDIVDNVGDGHYIPTYSPSEVTPSTSRGNGLPLNSRGHGAGACDYCHDDDGLSPPFIRDTAYLHHETTYALEGSLDCLVCHEILDPLNIRTCQRCHGPDSLHNIQADSLNPNNLGTVVVGGEDAGYGHVGKDAGPGESDCWGCHGYALASAPRTGPIIPTLYRSDVASIRAGVAATITLTGASFVNVAGTTLYESQVAMTDADGASVMLTPDLILDQGMLAVTIPGSVPPGNYDLRLVKGEFASNPAVISIVPAVRITSAVANGPVTITGRGFGGYAKGAGTIVTGTIMGARTRGAQANTMQATILSWTDTQIVARFRQVPQTVSVHSVFGAAAARVRSQ